MRCKLLRTDICNKFGKYYKKKFYEYGLYDKQELDKISEAHTKKRLEIMQLKESNPKKYASLSYPKLMIPTPTSQDVKECAYQHRKEKVFDVFVKHNNNVQVYVDEPEEFELKTIPVTEEQIEVKRGRPKNV